MSTQRHYHWQAGHTDDNDTLSDVISVQTIGADSDEGAIMIAEAALAVHPLAEGLTLLAILENEHGERIWARRVGGQPVLT